jgi:hypothetical protein
MRTGISKRLKKLNKELSRAPKCLPPYVEMRLAEEREADLLIAECNDKLAESYRGIAGMILRYKKPWGKWRVEHVPTLLFDAEACEKEATAVLSKHGYSR